MLLSRQCDNIYFGAELEFSPRPVDIPPPNSDWTQTLRDHHELEPRPDQDCPAWSEQERDELVCSKHFRFQATKLVVSSHAYGEVIIGGHVGDMPRDLLTSDKLVTFFEGQDWQYIFVEGRNRFRGEGN